MTARAQLQGQRFGRLIPVSFINGKWLCVCDCGRTTNTKSFALIAGRSKSCGCLAREHRIAAHTSHGKARTLTYWIWSSMKARCYRPSDKSYENYGGRGIVVCDRWRRNFAAFLEDMGECPAGYSIDREDVNGNYEPNNCRWIPMPEQAATKRTAIRKREQEPTILALRGAGLSQQSIADATGVPQGTVSRVLAAHGLRSRINDGRKWRSA
jgi:hypothetical protein